MADLYQHDTRRFSDSGLQLRLPPDLCPPGMYRRLTNAVPVIEGRLETRAPLNFLVNVANKTTPGSGLHSLTRLNQPAVNNIGDRIAGVDTSIQTYALPAGTVATQRDTTRTGDPLSLPVFHFNADPAAWQVISDRSNMNKYRSSAGGSNYQNLGIVTPQDLPTGGNSNGAATATAGAGGNLNNGAGPGYDWVYTFVNTVTQSESNPSIANFASVEGKSPTAFTSPDPGFGGVAADATGVATGTLTSTSASERRESILWKTWGTTANLYSQISLLMNFTVVVTGGSTGGTCYAAIYFSLDSGSTWKLAWDGSTSTPWAANYALTIVLPANTDISKLQVRATTFSVGNTTVPQNVIARRIRDRGGNFNITDLLTGGGGNATITLTMGTTIKTIGVVLGSAVTTLALANQQGVVCVVNPLLYDTQVDAIRLYRRGGSVTASWAFVGQFSVSSLAAGGCGINRLQITDNVADSNLGAFVNTTNDPPINSVFVQQKSLPYVWGPFDNPSRLFGCGDPDRPDAVYFSNAGNADQWGVGQWMDCSSPSDPMQNGCVYNQRNFAFSKERMFEIIRNVLGNTTYLPIPTPCSRGLISPWGLLATARAVYFVAKDGIYATTGGPEQSLVEDTIKSLFPTYDNPKGRMVGSYDAVDLERIEDIRLKFHNDELYFIYRGIQTGNLQMLVYDQNKNRWRAASYPVQIATIYSEEAGPASSLLLGDSTGSLYNTTSASGDVLSGSTPDVSVTIRTGASDQGLALNQKEYGNVIFDIDPGGATVAKPITITPLLNGEVITQAALTITGTGRQQIPLTLSDVFGFNIEFDITWSRNSTINPVLYQYDILWRPEPSAVTHWEARESSFGLPGFGHIRDAYIALRSTGTVTMTVTFDGTVQTYTIPSTSGQRTKVYVSFNSNKFKLAKFSFDTSDGTTFRLYEPDIELRVKPFLTNLGYKVLKPFGGESTMVTPAFESSVLSQ